MGYVVTTAVGRMPAIVSTVTRAGGRVTVGDLGSFRHFFMPYAPAPERADTPMSTAAAEKTWTFMDIYRHSNPPRAAERPFR